MERSPTLSTAPFEHVAMDYEALRAEGIEWIQRMAGSSWTDHNAHDPGITILEQLCYAITDLAYRADYDIQDLLASRGYKKKEEDEHDEEENRVRRPYSSLFTPAQILTTRAVTLTDLRKVVIDVKGVRNAWLEPIETPAPAVYHDPSDGRLYMTRAQQRQPVAMAGVYRVRIETETSSQKTAPEMIQKVKEGLHPHRGLCQDFEIDAPLNPQNITVNAEIEVGEIADPQQLLAQIYHAIAQFISPSIPFYSLDEMLERGKSMDEIFDGPALEYGFIDTDELNAFERKTALRTSDLIQVVMDIDGVIAIHNMTLSSGRKTEPWFLELNPDTTPVLDLKAAFGRTGPSGEKGPSIRFVRGRVVVQPDLTKAEEIYKGLRKATGRPSLKPAQNDVRLPVGRDRDIYHYHSIQDQFPEVYGVGEFGLPESAPPLRKAQAKQLKAYLMIFDQLLANAFSQLANVKSLFSFEHQATIRSYFWQTLPAVPGAQEIFAIDLGSDDHMAWIQELTEDDAAAQTRKHRFLNHLLARFGEQLTDYSLLTQGSGRESIESKCAFLRDYPQIAAGRGSAFDYTKSSGGTTEDIEDSEDTEHDAANDNVSGVERRISRKLGLPSYHRRLLAKDEMSVDDEAGFHVVEHLLLRPGTDDLAQWSGVNLSRWQHGAVLAQLHPQAMYSNRVSFVLPGWIDQFKEEEEEKNSFRELTLKTVREETPAHVGVHVCFLEWDQMRRFEAAYRVWLERMADRTDSADPRNITLRDARDRIINILGIGLTYPIKDLDLNDDDPDEPRVVATNESEKIEIRQAQEGVVYELHDEDGNPVLIGEDGQVKEDGQRITGSLKPGRSGQSVDLETPRVTKDVTYTIFASRQDAGITLETYLNRSVSIREGLNTKLNVSFVPSGQQDVSGREIVVDFRDKIKVRIDSSQEGVSYQLFRAPEGEEALSGAVIGKKESIELESSASFFEDRKIKVKAFRTSSPDDQVFLDTELIVNVRPNPAVELTVAPSIIEYGATANLSLTTGRQGSVTYQLYMRQIPAIPESQSQYPPHETPGGLMISAGDNQHVFLLAPEKITDWDDPSGFVAVGDFNETGVITTAALTDDTVFIVQAKKKQNGQVLQLDQAGAVLVRPDTTPQLTVRETAVEPGAAGMIRVNPAQKGVFYQLRLDPDNTPVNPPGYHLDFRGIGRVRVEVDLVVEAKEPPDAGGVVELPTESLTQATTFNVLAAKIFTPSVNAPLTSKATIQVQALPSS